MQIHQSYPRKKRSNNVRIQIDGNQVEGILSRFTHRSAELSVMDRLSASLSAASTASSVIFIFCRSFFRFLCSLILPPMAEPICFITTLMTPEATMPPTTAAAAAIAGQVDLADIATLSWFPE